MLILKVGMLKDFKGDKNKLGNAEKFLLALIVVPHYKLRLEGMIAKEDLKSTVDMLNEKIDILLRATEGRDMKMCLSLFPGCTFLIRLIVDLISLLRIINFLPCFIKRSLTLFTRYPQ